MRALLRTWRRVLVLFSGGIDSTLLLKIVADLLGENSAALTFEGPHRPTGETLEARKITRLLGVRHLTEDFDPFGLPDFRENTPERCYACKCEMYRRGWEIASKFEAEVLLDGTNLDDLNDTRPGLKAAQEMGVRSPFLKIGWRKADIRELSRVWQLPGWDRPPQSCLATRFPAYTHLRSQDLQKVDQVETFLGDKGFGPIRCRVHGDLVRLELPLQQRFRLLEPETLTALNLMIREQGWRYATLDLRGYQTGSMNLKE
ncbi:ATP-dependent sacrificial sulfur transferase LarE [Desulfobacca acetoxidans]